MTSIKRLFSLILRFGANLKL